MKNKKLLAIILLSLSFCFVSGVGYGAVETPENWITGEAILRIDFLLQKARIDYMMHNPIDFLGVNLFYDVLADRSADLLPEDIDTVGKVGIIVFDNRGIFSNETGRGLLKEFEKQLENIYLFVKLVATDMDTDVVAKLYSKEEIPLAYFSEGEYHLSEE